MRLDDLMDTILRSAPTDWHAIHGFPTYRDTLSGASDGEGHHWIEIESHHSVATFIPDASITMAWGISVVDDFKEPWANKFPDQHASSALADVFYNGALVYRTFYILVDGAQCKLPLPDSREMPGGVSESYGRFVHLLNRVDGNDEFESYFERAGLARMPGRPWPKLGSLPERGGA